MISRFNLIANEAKLGESGGELVFIENKGTAAVWTLW
jgi:hypothetical protein